MALSPENVSAVIPTLGNADLFPIRVSLPFRDIVIAQGPEGLWERFKAIERAQHEWIYTQDDDCLVDAAALIAQHREVFITCNMPVRKRAEYPDGIALVGWGAVFHRSMVSVFERYFGRFAKDALFLREADRVFTGLSPLNLVDVPFEHLPHAFGKDRLGAQPDHWASLTAIRQRIYAARA